MKKACGLLTIRMKVPMNSLRNSLTICLSRNLAIAPEERSSSRAARAAAMEDREEATDDDVDAVVAIPYCSMRRQVLLLPLLGVLFLCFLLFTGFACLPAAADPIGRTGYHSAD